MITFDRTTKILLGAIVVLLAIMIVQPRLKTSPEAFALDPNQSASFNVGTTYAYKVERISLINTPDKEKLIEVFAIPGAACFGVRYESHIEVYSVFQSPRSGVTMRASNPLQ